MARKKRPVRRKADFACAGGNALIEKFRWIFSVLLMLLGGRHLIKMFAIQRLVRMHLFADPRCYDFI